jgi:hypothetical protein
MSMSWTGFRSRKKACVQYSELWELDVDFLLASVNTNFIYRTTVWSTCAPCSIGI